MASSTEQKKLTARLTSANDHLWMVCDELRYHIRQLAIEEISAKDCPPRLVHLLACLVFGEMETRAREREKVDESNTPPSQNG